MVDMYVRLVNAGRRKIEEVPELHRDDVRNIIEGGNTNG